MQLAALSLEDFQRYSKGSHPKARLNFCVCAAQARKMKNALLLFKANDLRTDVLAYG